MSRETFERFRSRWCSAPGSARPATEEEIHFIELDLETVVPIAYKEFMGIVGACESPGILTAVTEAAVEMPDLHSICSCDDVIDSTRALWRDGMSRSLVAFAVDSLGNVFCFERVSDNSPPDDAAVWFFDRDFSVASRISDSFTEWIVTYADLAIQK